MRKLKLQMQQTINGFVAGPNGETSWMTREKDDRLMALLDGIAASSDTLLMGRKMAGGFVQYWESVKPGSPGYAFAEKMVTIPKIIFSKTIQKAAGKNVSVENGDLAETVNLLKAQSGKDILVYGGAGLATSLLELRLIDELYLIVNPVTIPDGLKIFTGTVHFELVTAIPCQGGKTVLQYVPGY